MSAPSRKEQLVDAALAVVAQSGGSALTLDAVAEQAGLSKGGLLYHFPTKEKLIMAMIDRALDGMDAAIDAAMCAEQRSGGGGPGAFARAYVRVSFATPGEGTSGLGGLLAAVATDLSMLDGYRARTQVWRKRMAADGLDPARAEAIRLATDGLYYNQLMGAAVPDHAGMAELETFLITLAGGT